MSKLIHITDQHLGGAYPEKAERSFDRLIEQLWSDEESPAYMPDVVFSTGDLTDRPLHVHSDHLKPFLRFAKAAQCPIVLLQGTMSHEPIGTINNIAEATDGKIIVIDSPFAEARIGEFSIYGIPGLSRPQIQKWCNARGIKIDGFADPVEALRAILSDISNNWSSGIRVLGGHFALTGCVTSSGHTLPGNDIELSLDDLAIAKPMIVTLGHIHQHQTWEHKGIHVAYGGSSHPCNFGELDAKGFSVYSFNECDQGFKHFRIPFPHRPMAKIELFFSGEQEDGKWKYESCCPDLPNQETALELNGEHEYKVVYEIPREIAASVDDAFVRLLFHSEGIELAAVERMIKSEKRERIEGIRSIISTRAQYEAWCNAKNREPRPGALVKASELDEVIE